jgi:NAD(P)-dependent dehydrogenase (short-subunit alcohol dehydrogenase family)
MTASTPSPDGRTVALVTGANKGIGREIARQLATQGMVVLASARDPERGEQAAAELRVHGDVHFIQIDVTDQASIDTASERIEREFGRLDVLINNAAISTDQQLPPTEVTVDQVRRAFETNVLGIVAVTHTMLPLLHRSPAARIVNMSSTQGSLALAADQDNPYGGPNLLAYNSSKAAVNAITLAYANELRETRIKINAASPGHVKTDLNYNTGVLTVEQGATVPVHLATLDPTGPTGAFINENGTPQGAPAPW